MYDYATPRRADGLEFDSHRGLRGVSVVSGLAIGEGSPSIPHPDARCILMPPEDAMKRGMKPLALTDTDFSKHVLFVGSIGTGKTNGIFQVLAQVLSNINEKDVVIIFDTKGDFYQAFYDKNQKHIVISNNELACGPYGTKNYWNLFEEIYCEEHGYKDLASEMASTLFKQQMEKTQQIFFPRSARDIMASLFVYFTRMYHEHRLKIDNAIFSGIMSMSNTAVIRTMLETYSDLRSVASYISDDDSPQTQGVISEFFQAVREYFVGNFNQSGDLSIRKIVREKGGAVVFVEYDISMLNALGPIYSLIIDMAIKEAIGRTRTEGNVWLFLDEFRLLPSLNHIDAAINFGRSLGVKVIIGLQNINQVFKSYGAEVAKSLLSGCSTIFTFRVTDADTRDFIQRLSGKQRRIEVYGAQGLIKDPMEHVAEVNVIEDWRLQSLEVGKSIVTVPSQPPFYFQFDLFDKVVNKRRADEYRKVLRHKTPA